MAWTMAAAVLPLSMSRVGLAGAARDVSIVKSTMWLRQCGAVSAIRRPPIALHNRCSSSTSGGARDDSRGSIAKPRPSSSPAPSSRAAPEVAATSTASPTPRSRSPSSRSLPARRLPPLPRLPPGTTTPTPPSRLSLAASRFATSIRTFDHRPYWALSRIDKPIGTWLLFWPCAWSMTLAAQAFNVAPLPFAWNLSLFAIGAFVMRGAGCTINDMWDARMDRMVERTRDRPLARGDITHRQALGFLAVQLSIGLAILLQLNWYSIALGASSLAVVVVYPLMKRVTYWPQLVLGFAFNWGAMLGWSALHAPPNWHVVLPLYAGSIAWTLVYDTIYAHQDKTDDVKAGVKSTALLFGDKTRPILATFSTAFVTSLAAAVATVRLPSDKTFSLLDVLGNHPIFSLALLPICAHLYWQIATVNLDSRADCWQKFVSNSHLGMLIWIALLSDYVFWYLLMRDDEGVASVAAEAR